VKREMSTYDAVLKGARLSKKEREAQRKAGVLTAIISILFFLLVYFVVVFKPPFEVDEMEGGGGGIEVALGTTDYGMGGPTDGVKEGGNPQEATPAPEQPQPATEAATPVENTDNPEEANVDTKPKVKEDPKPIVKPITETKPIKATTPITTPIETKPVKTKVERKVNQHALFDDDDKSGNGGSGGSAASQGNGNQAGNQGKANGTKGATNFDGDGGSTGGSTTGSTGGTGTGKGPGFNFTGLGNRKAVAFPELLNTTSREGKIVFEIEVDPAGNVVGVRGGIRGTTIPDDNLIKVNEQRIKKMKFTSISEGGNQFGKLTVYFKNQ
jgi:outer membrane biosynthesis protein TonB